MIVLFIIAVVGFIASVVVHLSTFLDRPPVGVFQTWPLHLGIFLAGITATTVWRKGDEGGRQKRPHEREPPRWMYRAVGVCSAYAMVNFLVCWVLLFGVSPRANQAQPRDGRYVVMRGDVIVDEVTEAEYWLTHGRGLRMFSGIWMFFYAFSGVGTLEGAMRRAAERARQRPPLLPRIARTSAAYVLEPAPRLSPWAHATLQWSVAMACCTFFSVFVVVPAGEWLAAKTGSGWICVPLSLAAIVVAGYLPAKLFERHVAARCPNCAGRSFCNHLITDGQRKLPGTYTCRDCGHVCCVGGGAWG